MMKHRSALDLEVDHDAGRAVICLRGSLDAATAPLLRQLIRHMVADGTLEVVLDVRQVEVIDAAGLGVMAAARWQLVPDGGAVSLRSPSPAVLRVLEATGVARYFTIDLTAPEPEAVPAEM
jgi:anti-anti-sigma factor